MRATHLRSATHPTVVEARAPVLTLCVTASAPSDEIDNCRLRTGLPTSYTRLCFERAAAVGMAFGSGRATRLGGSGPLTLHGLITIAMDQITEATYYPRRRVDETYRPVSSGSKLVARKGDIVLVVESLNKTEACPSDRRGDQQHTRMDRLFFATRNVLMDQVYEQRLKEMAERASVNVETYLKEYRAAENVDEAAAIRLAVDRLPEVCGAGMHDEERCKKLIEGITRHMPDHGSREPAGGEERLLDIGQNRLPHCGRLLAVIYAINPAKLMKKYADVFGFKVISVMEVGHESGEGVYNEWIGAADLDDINERCPWLNRGGEELEQRLYYSEKTSWSRRSPDAGPVSALEYANPGTNKTFQTKKAGYAKPSGYGFTQHHPAWADLFQIWINEGCPSDNPKCYWVGNPGDYRCYRPTEMVVECQGDQRNLRCTVQPQMGSSEPPITFFVPLVERLKMWEVRPGTDGTDNDDTPVDMIDCWEDRHRDEWICKNSLMRMAAAGTGDWQRAYDELESKDAEERWQTSSLSEQQVRDFVERGTAREAEITAVFENRRLRRWGRRHNPSAAGISGCPYA
mmetsp:Transcript_6322/g.10877  ORF Transcript_6322/g.10877 Transcript_6322/m.10877 type:complete len:573 (-) Transcript_6322:1282-3000(-)